MSSPSPLPLPPGQTALLTVFLGVAMKVTGGNPQGLHNQVSPALVNQRNPTTTDECTDQTWSCSCFCSCRCLEAPCRATPGRTWRPTCPCCSPWPRPWLLQLDTWTGGTQSSPTSRLSSSTSNRITVLTADIFPNYAVKIGYKCSCQVVLSMFQGSGQYITAALTDCCLLFFSSRSSLLSKTAWKIMLSSLNLAYKSQCPSVCNDNNSRQSGFPSGKGKTSQDTR